MIDASRWAATSHRTEKFPTRYGQKGGNTMTGITEIIVGMWFLPVTLFIVVPLVMFAVWHLALGWACHKNPITMCARNREERTHEPKLYSPT